MGLHCIVTAQSVGRKMTSDGNILAPPLFICMFVDRAVMNALCNQHKHNQLVQVNTVFLIIVVCTNWYILVDGHISG